MPTRSRQPVNVQRKSPFEQQFEKYSLSVYSAMRERFKPKKTDGGFLTAGRIVPFTLPEFRVWALQAFSGSCERPGRCHYCKRPISAINFATDHAEPVKFGGSLELANLRVCCEECNRIKGVLSEDGFVKLLAWVWANLHTQDANDVMGRLKQGGAYQGLLRQQSAMRRRAKPTLRR